MTPPASEEVGAAARSARRPCADQPLWPMPDPAVLRTVNAMEIGVGERGSRAALAGGVFAVLFLIGWLLMQQSPPFDAPTDEFVDYFSDTEQRRASLIAGLYVVPFAGIAFIWFMAALRDRYVRSGAKENVLLSTVHLVSGALFVAALFAVASVELALVWIAEQASNGVVDPESARTMAAFATAMAQIIALRSGAVFIAVSTTRAMRSGLFPRWFGITSMASAVLLLFSFSALPVVALLMPIWVVASSALVLARRSTRDLPTGA